jgi:hypothetical protein
MELVRGRIQKRHKAFLGKTLQIGVLGDLLEQPER